MPMSALRRLRNAAKALIWAIDNVESAGHDNPPSGAIAAVDAAMNSALDAVEELDTDPGIQALRRGRKKE